MLQFINVKVFPAVFGISKNSYVFPENSLRENMIVLQQGNVRYFCLLKMWKHCLERKGQNLA